MTDELESLRRELAATRAELAEARREQAATSDVLRAIAASPGNVQPVLDRLVETVCKLCEASDAVIMLRDGDDLSTPAHHGPIPVPPNAGRRPVSRDWPPGRAVAEGRTIHVPDLAEAQDEYPLAVVISTDVARDASQSAPQPGLAWRTALAVPLMRKGEALGTIVLRRVDVSPFSDAQIALLQSFADQAVIAIQNADLFNQVQTKTRDLSEALVYQTGSANILKVIAASPTDVEPVLQAIVDSACEVCGAYDAAVILREGDFMRFSAHRGPIPLGMEGRPLDRGWVGGRAVVDRAPVHVHDLLNAGEDFPDGQEMARRMGHRTILAVPLIRDGDSVGAIVVRRNEMQPFTDKQIALLSSFADQAVIAIENVRLFDEVQARTKDLEESLAQQTATAEVLKAISRSAFDLDGVLKTLVESATELCRASVSSISVVEGGFCRFRAFAGASPEYEAFLRERPVAVADATRATNTGRVLLTKAKSYIEDVTAEPGYNFGQAPSLGGFRAVLGVPLLRDGEVIGVFQIAAPEPRALNQRQIDLVGAFADQAVIAIENVRLFDEVQARTRALEKALERQTATAEILRVIASSPADVQPVFDAIVSSAKRLLGAKDSTLTHIIGDRSHLVAFTPTNPEADAARRASFPRSHEDPVVVTISAGQSVLIADTETDESAIPWRDTARKTGNRSLVVVPLMNQGKAVGGLAVGRAAAGAFAEEDLDLLRTFADQAVIAIENARLLNDLRESLAQQTATADVLKVISRSGADLDVMLQTLADTAGAFCGNSTIHLQQDGLMRLRVHFGGTPEWIAYLHKRPFPATRATLAGRAWVTGEIVHIPDIPNETDLPWGRAAEISGYCSAIAVPIVSRSHGVVGVFSYGGAVTHAFSPRRIELLKSFADQAAIAIDNARLLDEVQARTRELEKALERQTATAEILKVIASSPADVQPVFDAIVTSAKRLLGGQDSTLTHFFGAQAHLAAFTPTSPESDAAVKAYFPRSLEEDPIVETILAGRSIRYADVEADEALPFVREVARKTGYRSLVVVPLTSQGKTIGGLSVSCAAPGAIADEDVELLRTFADQAAIAIENARLLNDIKESLAQQTATAELLKVISRSAFDLEPALVNVCETAARLCNADRVAIYRREGEYFRFQASYGFPSEYVNAYRAAGPGRIDPASPLVGHRAVVERRPVQVLDVTADPAFFATTSRAADVRTSLGVPLLREGEPVGNFVLARKRVEAFSPRQLELIQTFADQAVIAIENARLIEEVQARTRELEEALQIQTATSDVLKVISRSAFELDPIFQTLVATAVDLCKASSGTLCVRDGGVFRYRGMAGPEATTELQRYLEDHPLVSPSRATIAGRVILSRQVEEIHDVLQEEGYAVPFAAHGSPARSLLGVPLLGKTEVQGAIVVTRSEPGAFPLRHVEILRTFADQAVIAIENSRLFEEVQARTHELEQSLDDLRKAQDRLVQTEKLASLGQLTAGIAHEIKNPLNFVNNFSALSRELLGELKEVVDAHPPPPEPKADIDDLLAMLDSNLDKVVHHGQRADSIVKNMLRHSREGSSERTRVSVNAMVEEALNLAYHGARAEKPGFNVTISKRLDPQAGEIDLYVQEMTRVLLNLVSNGFYATEQRKRGEATGYEPTLTAETRDLGDRVEIRVRDNGTGIPDEVKAKMFNPFFTTKPAGEGTGLGLSLSHDIVVKQHGGTIDVATERGAFTEFVVTLPRGRRNDARPM